MAASKSAQTSPSREAGYDVPAGVALGVPRWGGQGGPPAARCQPGPKAVFSPPPAASHLAPSPGPPPPRRPLCGPSWVCVKAAREAGLPQVHSRVSGGKSKVEAGQGGLAGLSQLQSGTLLSPHEGGGDQQAPWWPSLVTSSSPISSTGAQGFSIGHGSARPPVRSHWRVTDKPGRPRPSRRLPAPPATVPLSARGEHTTRRKATSPAPQRQLASGHTWYSSPQWSPAIVTQGCP